MVRLLRPLLPVLFMLSLAYRAPAQERWWIFFKDKPADKALASDLQLVSERSLLRRAKVMPAGHLTGWSDAGVSPQYISALRSAGLVIHAVSRTLNAVSAAATSDQRDRIAQFPFVTAIEPVRTGRRRPEPARPVTLPALQKFSRPTSIDYGPSLPHHESMNSIPLHELGVIGHGVLVGMIDDGFNNYRSHAALRSVPVLAAYDFIQRDTNVSIETGDHLTQGFHGAATMSVLAGFDEGSLVGPAYGAMLALAKTEVGGSETIIEEDYYVEGLEWLDSVGVDIISSSLGYIDWYTYSDLDGQTAITTKVARTLASRGILLVTAMGNEGTYQADRVTTGTLIAPADADSILSVGAVSAAGFLTGFSSTGPTADGRVKPDVVSQGSTIIYANWSDPTSYFIGQGTSFSTPLTSAAAALVLSAHPDATAMQVRDAIRNTAVRMNDGTARTASYPNSFYGWGRVDAYAAALSLGPVVSNIPIVRYAVVGTEPSLIVTVRAASSSTVDMARFALYARRTSEATYVRYPVEPDSGPGVYTARIPVTGPSDTLFVGYLSIADQSGPELRRPVGSAVFALHPTSDSLASLFPPASGSGIPETFTLQQNFPNPFNPGTTISFRAPRAEQVELSVYNVLGQKLVTLFSGISTPGIRTVTWTPVTDASGRALPSGIYLLRLSTTEGEHIRKMMLLK